MNHFISSSKWYELFLPDGWTNKEEEDCISFFNSLNGVGAFQISSFSFPVESETTANSVLREYLNDKDIKINENNFENTEDNNVSIGKYQYTLDNNFWCIWALTKINKLLFVTYNCNMDDRNIEYHIVEKIVASIKIN